MCNTEEDRGEGGFLKDTNAMSALHITDEIIALNAHIDWTAKHTSHRQTLALAECEPKNEDNQRNTLKNNLLNSISEVMLF